MNPTRLIMLLGRKDEPTDALRDYCRYLCAALSHRGAEIDTSEVNWDLAGWVAGCKSLWRESGRWKQSWALLQYTALSWSRRGIPIGLFAVLAILKARGVRIAIVFHDSNPFSGSRFIDRMRRWFQRSIMRLAYRCSDKSFFSIPLEKISWLPEDSQKARFIPIGANIPVRNNNPVSRHERKASTNGPESPLTVAIFGVTGGSAFDWEFRQIIHALSQANRRLPLLRLKVIGRGAEEAGPALRDALKNTTVALSIPGMLPDAEVASELAEADVMLFARGHLTGSRGSALAGIACGLPIVAYEGPETAAPITEAGVALAASDNADALADALVRVLSDEAYRRNLRERSRTAYQAYFSWDRIADRFCAELADA